MDMPFPPQLYPRQIIPHPMNQSQSGGVATNGDEQVIGSAAWKWSVKLVGCPVFTEDQILAYRGFIYGMDGKVGRTLVPSFDWLRANWPADGLGRVLSPEFTRRPQLDGTIYADPPVPEQSRIEARMLAPAALRATTVQIGVTQGRPIRVGHFFSIGPRLHVVVAIPAANSFTIRPPLREAAAAGTPVNFSAPICRMRLADDDGGVLALDYGRWGFVDLDFVEAD